MRIRNNKTVSIRARVTPQEKESLLIKAQQQGFQDFSKWLRKQLGLSEESL